MWNNVNTLIFTITATLSHQLSLDNPCTLESTGSPGICKLLSDCITVRDDVIKYQRLPQLCGLEHTQSIVCCPTGKRKPGAISKKKCREYSIYAHEKSKNSNNECGHKITKRIVGGEIALKKEFPHMAAIGYGSSLRDATWSCGGTLISDQHVLTAAHCIRNHGREAKFVTIGVTNLKDINHRQRFKIVESITHPDYMALSHYHDIGLLKLEKPVNISSYARPACLYIDSEISFKQAIATGWGAISWDGSPVDQLHKVTLDVIDYETCQRSYPKSAHLKLKHGISIESQFCVGLGLEEKDSCKGDGGGPLQIYHTVDDAACMYDIVGVISFGKSCVGGPSVNMKIFYYLKWIEDIVWPLYT